MKALSSEVTAKIIRRLLEDVILKVPMLSIYTIWERRNPKSGEILGMLVYRAQPHDNTTPVVVWIDTNHEGKLCLSTSYRTTAGVVAESFGATEEEIARMGKKFLAALQSS